MSHLLSCCMKVGVWDQFVKRINNWVCTPRIMQCLPHLCLSLIFIGFVVERKCSYTLTNTADTIL